MKLGSLFSGIGGFELVGNWYGIEPVWASEIEDACIRITKKHFPNMKHFGDITKIHGDQIEPVDVITGGSPCQDLSVAGKQSGIRLKCDKCGTLVEFSDGTQSCPNCGAELDFTRSGLFMEQMRIIREMRKKQMNAFQKLLSGKTCSEHSAATTETTSSASSKSSVSSWQKNFLRLDLRAGQTQGRFWENPVPSHGDSLTLNIGECPNVVVESSLSQILEDNAPEKYYLSQKACVGILHRAQRRGKELPPRLKAALENQAGIQKDMEQTHITPQQIVYHLRQAQIVVLLPNKTVYWKSMI